MTQVLDHLGRGHRRGEIQLHRTPPFRGTEHTIILSFSLQENVRSPLPFIYLFILISAYKWYMKPFTLKRTWLMTGTGLGFFLLYTCASIMLSLLGIDEGIFITGLFKLPVIMVGFGMFLLFGRLSFRKRIINRIAQSAFAVYLITDYAASEKLLWDRLFNLQNLYQQPLAILQILGILLAIYVACTLLDFIRQALFAVTIDRHRGRWFELLWNKSSKQIKTLQEHRTLN